MSRDSLVPGFNHGNNPCLTHSTLQELLKKETSSDPILTPPHAHTHKQPEEEERTRTAAAFTRDSHKLDDELKFNMNFGQFMIHKVMFTH